MTPTFSIIVPTSGRPTLSRMFASLAPQLGHGDEVMVVRSDCEYGNESRDSAVARAEGSHLLFMDDDDVYTPAALNTIRQEVASEPSSVHVFRMSYSDGRVLWGSPTLEVCNIGTPMLCIPNEEGKIGKWENGLGPVSDFEFIRQTMELRADAPVFHEDVVALVRPL